jgi:hypothetical protein
MAVNDFLPVATDPGAYVDTQGTYAGSGYQIDGLQPGITLGRRLNKCLRQGTVGTAVLGELVKNILSLDFLDDGNLATQVSRVQAVISALASSGGAPVEVDVAFSATPVFDCNAGNPVFVVFQIKLTGNVTSSTLVNLRKGQKIVFIIVEDSFGGHTFTWPTNVNAPGDIDTTTSVVNRQEFVVHQPFGTVIASATGPMVSN